MTSWIGVCLLVGVGWRCYSQLRQQCTFTHSTLVYLQDFVAKGRFSRQSDMASIIELQRRCYVTGTFAISSWQALRSPLQRYYQCEREALRFYRLFLLRVVALTGLFLGVEWFLEQRAEPLALIGGVGLLGWGFLGLSKFFASKRLFSSEATLFFFEVVASDGSGMGDSLLKVESKSFEAEQLLKSFADLWPALEFLVLVVSAIGLFLPVLLERFA